MRIWGNTRHVGPALVAVAALTLATAAYPGGSDAAAASEPHDVTAAEPGAATDTPSATAEPAATDAAASDGGVHTVDLPVQPSAQSAPPPPTAHDEHHGENHGEHHHEPGDTGTTIVQTDTVEVDPFELAAVTWRGDDHGATVWVRFRHDGSWSEWFDLASDADHAPDPGSAEGTDVRGGTVPLVVPRSDAVQVRIDTADGTGPDDLRLDLVDPGVNEAAAAAAATAEPDAAQAAESDAAQAAETQAARAPRPTIRSRASWGADESMRADPPEFGRVRGAFVHHTVSANAYSRSAVPGIIRSIYRYHVQSRGWNDLGYNFLVDRFGRIWEGRFGGVAKPVIGAHTYGYNDEAFALSAIGTFTKPVPTVGMRRAYQRLFAWKFTVHGVDPREPARYDQKRLPAISGHRDASATECPGDALYARMAQIRRGTIAAMGLSPSRDLNRNWRPDLLATTPAGRLYLATGKHGGYGPPRLVGGGWAAMNALAVPGDWNSDGIDDLIARRRSDGSLWLYPSEDNGKFGAKRQIGWGWQGMDVIIGSDDFDGDGRAEVIARRRSNGSLWLYPRGQGTSFAKPRRIGTGWDVMNAIVAPGDWDGDGVPDVIARRRSDATLWLYPGRRGGFRPAKLIGYGYGGYQLIAAGDVDEDGYADLVGRTVSGDLVLFRGDGRGGIAGQRRLNGSWEGYNRIA